MIHFFFTNRKHNNYLKYKTKLIVFFSNLFLSQTMERDRKLKLGYYNISGIS